MKNRRETLKVMAAAAVVPAAQQGARFFSAGEYACVAAVAARIIPSDGTPGAAEAGVADYIDETVKANAKLHLLYRAGIASLGTFPRLSKDRQDAILRKLEEEKGDFWKSIRRLTIDGFYTSTVGLKELGYSGKSFLSEFKGCVHPEHQS